MIELSAFEPQKASGRLIIKRSTVITTADTSSDEKIVNAAAASVHAAGVKPLAIWTGLCRVVKNECADKI